jgi:flagellin-specific chaperone FliS
MLKHLLDVNIRNDAKAAADVIKLLEPLRASWHQLAARGAAAARAPAGKGGSQPAPSGLRVSA